MLYVRFQCSLRGVVGFFLGGGRGVGLELRVRQKHIRSDNMLGTNKLLSFFLNIKKSGLIRRTVSPRADLKVINS